MEATHTGLMQLPATRREMLLFLKRRGEATAEAMATATGITTSGARQHLVALERDSLVAHTEQRAGAGRPKFLYHLAPAGETLFARQYAALTNELLGYVEAEDAPLLARIFDKRGERRLTDACVRLAGLPFAEKIARLAHILDEDGYLADYETLPDGTYRITEHNCAVLNVALRYGHACRSEIDFLRAALPEAEVTRVAHMVTGGHVCAYHIVPRSQE